MLIAVQEPKMTQNGAKIVRVKFAAADFEAWRRKHVPWASGYSLLAKRISSNLRQLEKCGPGQGNALRAIILEDLAKLIWR